MTGDSPSREELHTAAAHGLRWSAISRPVVEVVQFGGIIVLARLIAPAEFGRYAIASITAEVALLLVAGGLTSALVQRKTLDREHTQTGVAIALLAGLALTVLTLLAASLVIAPIFGARTALFVRLMAPLCLLEALAAVPVSVLRRRMDFRRLSEIEILNNVVRVVGCIALALLGLSGEALVLGMIAGSLAGLVVAWISAPPPLPRLHRAAARDLLGYAAPMSLATISWVGFFNIDYAIIGARLGPLQTGYYYRAYTLAVEYQSKLAIVMNQVGFPVLARTNGAAELAQLYRQMIRLLTIVLFPALVLLTIAAPVVVPFVFGARWDPAVVPVQILALGGASTIIFNAVKTVWMSTGRVGVLLGFGWAQFIVYGITVFLVAPLGITAVAIDAAIVHAFFAILAYVLMLRGSTERPLWRLWDDVAPAIVSCLGLVVVALPVSVALTAAQVPAILWLAALGTVAIPPYLLTLRICFPATWRAQCTVLERVLPGHRRLNGMKRRLALAAH
jgi:O-antigen/teichoic acid export membrane protein